MKFSKILISVALIYSNCVWALDWESVYVSNVIDTEHLLLSDSRIIKLIGYDGPDINFPTLQERSSARRTFQLLKHLLVGENIKILRDKSGCEGNICPRHVKTMDGEYLVEKLLSKGLGKFRGDGKNSRFNKKYQAAESKAQELRLGQWGDTSWNKSARHIRKLAGVNTLEWKKKFGHYLAPISIGRVDWVKNGNTFYLDNGLCVKLLGVDSPTPSDPRRGHSCFGTKSKEYLSSLIMGKKIELRKDISQTDERRCLLRHVWIPGDIKQMRSDVHVNLQMIKDGYGRANIPIIDKQYHKEFNSEQMEVYQNPRGAWLECAKMIMSKN